MSKYNVNVAISTFKHQPQSIQSIKSLIKSLEEILEAIYSAVISLKMFFFNQYIELETIIQKREKRQSSI